MMHFNLWYVLGPLFVIASALLIWNRHRYREPDHGEFDEERGLCDDDSSLRQAPKPEQPSTPTPTPTGASAQVVVNAGSWAWSVASVVIAGLIVGAALYWGPSLQKGGKVLQETTQLQTIDVNPGDTGTFMQEAGETTPKLRPSEVGHTITFTGPKKMTVFCEFPGYLGHINATENTCPNGPWKTAYARNDEGDEEAISYRVN